MDRKAKCTECGKWFYNHNGLFIVLKDTYDDRMCKNCNDKIDAEVRQNDGLTKYQAEKMGLQPVRKIEEEME